MPKMKTRKCAAKRLQFTGTGKVRFRSNYNSHLLTRKSTKRKRGLQTAKLLDPSLVPVARVMVPYHD